MKKFLMATGMLSLTLSGLTLRGDDKTRDAVTGETAIAWDKTTQRFRLLPDGGSIEIVRTALRTVRRTCIS